MGHKPWDRHWKRVENAKAKRTWRDEAGREQRTYGVDVTDDFETIAQATRMEDGTLHLDVVVLERHDHR